MKSRIIGIVLFLFCNTTLLAQSLHPITDKKDRYGYADEQGNIVIPCKYNDALPFEEGVARVQKGSKYGLMNTSGKFVLDPKYDEIGSFAHGVAKVRSGKKYGMVNAGGMLVLPAKYDNIAPFRDGVAVVSKGKKYGLISQNGNLILPVEYAVISPFNQYGKAWINKGGKIQKKGELKDHVLGGKFGIMSIKGGIVVSPIYKTLGELTDIGTKASSISSISSFSSFTYYEAPKTDCKYLVFSEKQITAARGLLGENGEVLIPSNVYQSIAYPHSDMAAIQKTVGKKKKDRQTIYGYRNLTNHQEILLPVGFMGQSFTGNTASITKVPQVQVKMPKGSTLKSIFAGVKSAVTGDDSHITKATTEIANEMVDNATAEAQKNKVTVSFSLINKQGDVIFDNLSAASPCKEDKIVIIKDAKFGVVDVQRAELIIPFGEFDGLSTTFSNGVIGAMKAGKWGLIDANQKEIVPFEYTGISNAQHGYFAGKKDSLSWGLFDIAGRQVMPCKYADVRLPEEDNPTHTWVKKDTLWYSYDIQNQKESDNVGYVWVSAFKDGMAQASMEKLKLKNDEVTQTALNAIKKNTPTMTESELVDVLVSAGNNTLLSTPSQVYIVSQDGAKLFPFLVPSSLYEETCAYIKKGGGKALNKTVAHRFLLSQTRDQRNYQLTSIIPDSDWDY
jgi:hypothetical protein